MTEPTTHDDLPLREAVARAIYDRGPGEWTPIDDDDPASEYRRLEAHESITWEMRLRDADAALAVIAARQPTREEFEKAIGKLESLRVAVAERNCAGYSTESFEKQVDDAWEALDALIDRALIGGDDEGY